MEPVLKLHVRRPGSAFARIFAAIFNARPFHSTAPFTLTLGHPAKMSAQERKRVKVDDGAGAAEADQVAEPANETARTAAASGLDLAWNHTNMQTQCRGLMDRQWTDGWTDSGPIGEQIIDWLKGQIKSEIGHMREHHT